jgi:hypothetical protein
VRKRIHRSIAEEEKELRKEGYDKKEEENNVEEKKNGE